MLNYKSWLQCHQLKKTAHGSLLKIIILFLSLKWAGGSHFSLLLRKDTSVQECDATMLIKEPKPGS